jgi:energy-coupling factor transporter transmembrane protein EcfT
MISGMDRLLGPLEKTGIPVKEFFAIMGLTMKSFPLLTAHLSKTYREERENMNIRGFRNRMGHMVTFMMPVFIESIRTPERFFIGESEKAG